MQLHPTNSHGKETKGNEAQGNQAKSNEEAKVIATPTLKVALIDLFKNTFDEGVFD